MFEYLGLDVARIERGIAHLRQRFHHLTPDLVRYHAAGGTLAGLILFDINEDVLYWLRARQEKTIASMTAVRSELDKLDRKVEIGGIPRTAAFSALTGQNYQRLGPVLDYIFPKHYFWHRGFDGLYGTVSRWVKRIAQWNPSLAEEDCFAVVKAWFGIDLPRIHSLTDMDEIGFPEEFFTEVAYRETKRALEAVGDDDKVICWVDTGRSSHAGTCSSRAIRSPCACRRRRINSTCRCSSSLSPTRMRILRGRFVPIRPQRRIKTLGKNSDSSMSTS